jgi:hypothetical protein
MLNSQEMLALVEDKQEHERLLEILDGYRTAREAIKESDMGRQLERLSARIDGRHEPRLVLEQIGELFNDEFVLKFLRQELAGYEASPLYALSVSVIEGGIVNGMVLYDDPRISIALTTVAATDVALKRFEKRGKQTGVSIGARDVLFRFVKSGRTRLKIWRAAPIGFYTRITDSLHCAHEETIEVRTGSKVFMNGGREAFSFDELESPVVMLSVSAKPVNTPVNAQYDTGTGRLAGVSAADDKSSRIQLLATLLGTLRPDSVNETIKPFLMHRDHFVRWHVMRQMLAADTEAALPHLEFLRDSDPHPQIAEVAGETARIIREQ